MTPSESNDSVTELLERWRRGDRAAEDALVARVYPVLREVAHAQMRRNSGALTLQATQLANEAYSSGKGLLEVIREKKILTEEQIKDLLDPAKLTNLDRSKYKQ